MFLASWLRRRQSSVAMVDTLLQIVKTGQKSCHIVPGLPGGARPPASRGLYARNGARTRPADLWKKGMDNSDTEAYRLYKAMFANQRRFARLLS